jgi:FkbM family methyltransferase
MSPTVQQHQNNAGAMSSGMAALMKPPRELLISYAQNFEDVLLHRVFSDVEHGFYVDVGAFDPVIGSVTKLLYDRGWNGINIEPGPAFARLVAARPRDINLNIAILDERGTATFVENTADPGASHIETSTGSEHGNAATRAYSVPCDRLDHVVAEHAGDRLINLMKIDAEGSETRIVRATDWTKIRPQVLVIEAVAPWTNQLIAQDWEPTLLASGYKRAYFDGLNLFFVRDEDADLLRHFDRPVNALDWFAKYDPVKDQLERANRELAQRNADQEAANRELAQQNAGHEAANRELAQQNAYQQAINADQKEWIFQHLERIASSLERVPRRRRGLDEQRALDIPVAGADEFEFPKPERLLRELDIVVDCAIRFDRFAVLLDQMLQARRGVSAPSDLPAAQSRPETRVPEPEQLLQELEGVVRAAIRCDRIIGELEDPAGPRALRMVLPLARLIRATRSRAAEGFAAAKPVRVDTPPGSARSRLRTALNVIKDLPRRGTRRAFRPIALRTRAFLLEPLTPLAGSMEAMARDVQAIRHALADPQVADRLSPELVKSIEALLLTVAVWEPRR